MRDERVAYNNRQPPAEAGLAPTGAAPTTRASATAMSTTDSGQRPRTKQDGRRLEGKEWPASTESSRARDQLVAVYARGDSPAQSRDRTLAAQGSGPPGSGSARAVGPGAAMLDPVEMHPNQLAIDVRTVHALVGEQFPAWARPPIRPIVSGGR